MAMQFPTDLTRKSCFEYLTILFNVALSIFMTAGATLRAEDQVEFNRDILPILSDNCFACHGPDEKTRHAGLRLDLSDPARAKLESGHTAIVPGNATDSELIRRILSADPYERMPPLDSGKSITPSQIELL